MIWVYHHFRKHPIDPFPDHTLPVMLHFHSLQAGVCMIRFHVDSNKIGAFELSVFPYLTTIYYSWWLNQPNWNILVKLDHFPNHRAKNEKNVWNHQLDLKLTYSQHPKKKLFWFTRILWWLQNANTLVGKFWWFQNDSATASHQTSSKNSRVKKTT